MHVVVVEPPKPVVSLAEAKAQVDVDHDEDDILLTALIDAATAELDGPGGWLGRALSRQTLRTLPDPCDWRLWHSGRYALDLPYPPTRSQDPVTVTAISYLNSSGMTVDLTEADWSMSPPGRALITSAIPWGSNDVAVTYETGTPIPQGQEMAPVDERARQAILLSVAGMYANRESEVIDARAVVAANPAVERLLSALRVWAA